MSFHKPVFVYLILFASFTAHAQQTGKIYGQLSDTVTHQQLKDAFITITKDNVIRKSFFADKSGGFSADNIPFGQYTLNISFQGLAPVKRAFTIDSEHNLVKMDTIFMFIRVRELDTVVILEPPIVVKKDTLEYNSSRFKTKEYAVLAELLKMLPGIQIRNDGTITINGQPVDQITVDGEPFFSGEPSMALEHLPAEIVKKIQVYATNIHNNMPGPPPQPGFPGNKTLNIVLKSDKRKGNFGKLGAGAGTGDTYTINGDLNHMNGSQQLSIVADAGNVDKEKNGTDPVQQNNGIRRVMNGGLNYRDSRNATLKYNGSYLANDTRSEVASRSQTLIIYPGDSSTSLSQSNNGVNQMRSHRFNGKIDYNPDDRTTLSIIPMMNLNSADNTSFQESTQHYANTGTQIYQSSGTSSGKSNNTQLSSNFQLTRRGTKIGELLIANLNIRNTENTHNSLNETVTAYTSFSKNVHQLTDNKSGSFNVGTNAMYTKPLGKNYNFTAQGSYGFNKDNNIYNTYKFNNANGHYDQLDPTQSNNFTSNYHSGIAQASIRGQAGILNITLGAGLQGDWLLANNVSEHTQFSRHFINLLPQALLSLSPKNGKNLMLGYNGKPISISIQQLQPVTVTSDSLFIQEGNPDLKQPYTHTFNMSYNAIKIGTMRLFTISMSASFTEHSIAQSGTLLANGAQLSKPVNLEGTRSANLTLNYATSALSGKLIFNITGAAVYSKNPVLSNGVRNDSRTFMTNSDLTCTYNNQKGWDLSLSVEPGYNIMSTSSGVSTRYFQTGINGKGLYSWKNLESGLTWYYNYNSSLPADYQPDFPVLSPVVRYRFLKSKALQAAITCVDLLNQQSGASRTVSASEIADSWSKTRGRYLLFSLTYNFRHFK
ncbi:outer membrane beta-barrel protein [Chitinophaga sancti]|uniref:Outer membrane beta-barrel protein n=1 Tax=Chitinophaga sancti TaxID=1004 RepID=A0A1K1QNG9_9BACT|nr:outer membrane beta-barrel protein [Chitinophaga sancti]WQD65081.1 outer membrane beta-barrel protein [Chitinophaga sancti]WQG89295.1 outer membrane beta-barrel protein [Chitinophaga sancti]SFW61309.1 Outer membrane protein beta-barrel family protein [Chitinophaga sancti]